MKLGKALRVGALALSIAGGALTASTLASGGSYARGVDVSDHQGTINWARAAANGVSFAIVRVSDGTQHHDSQFAANWANTKANGIVRGVYQFFRPNQSGVAQADLLLSRVGQFEPGDLPPVLDVEVTDGASSSTISAGITAWVNEIESRTGLTPMIYTSPGFWNGLAHRPSLPGVQLWVANWGVSSPRIPAGWSNWAFWQNTDQATGVGISSGADGDYFHGTVADLRAFAASHGTSGGGSGTTTPPPPSPTPTPTPAPSGGSHPVLRKGSTGAAVVELQNDLTAKGFSPGASDGDFGPRTLAAVEAFQSASGLSADGIVGPLTWAALTR